VREAGDLSYSTLVKNLDNTYTLTAADGSRREFSTIGLLTSRVDTLGNTRSYAYVDADSDSVADEISTITDHVGRVIEFTYTSGRVTSVEDFDGTVTTLGYDGNGRLTTVTRPDPDGGGAQTAPVTTYEYDATTGLLERIESPREEETLIEYDHARKVSLITQACGGESEYAAFRSLGVVDLSLSGYDAMNPAPLVSADVVETRTDELDNETDIVRDRYGNIIEETDALGRVTTYERNADGLVTRITQTDPDGAGPLGALVTEFEYDSNGNLIQRTNADLTEEFWTYDVNFNQMTSYTDAIDRVTLWEIGVTTGLVLSMTRVVGQVDDGINLETDDVTTSYTYTDGLGTAPPGLLETMTDALGVVASYTYNARGLVLSITQADGTADETTTSFEYDASDNLTAVVDGLSRRTEYDYDGLNRLVTLTEADPDGGGVLASPVWQYQYDADGNRTHVTDPLGNVTEYVYDERGRLTEVISPDPDGAGPLLAPETVYDFDCVSNLASLTDALGRTTEYQYDELNRLVKAILPDPDGGGVLVSPEVDYAYNAVGWLASETDALGNVTTYTYDEMGRVLSITQPDPDGGGVLTAPVTSYTYDDAGQLLTITDPLGRVTTYAYDDLGRVTSITSPDPDGGGAGLAPVTAFTYDKLGNVLTESVKTGASTWSVTTYDYDNLYRRTSITDANNDLTEFTYDDVGNVLTMTDPENNVTEYEYDNLNRLIAETIAVSTVALTRQFVYDAAGNLIEKTDRNGRVTEYEYDNLHRRIEERWLSGMSVIETFSYSYDAAGQLLSAGDGAADYDYDYDDLGRVLLTTHDYGIAAPAIVFDHAYDAAGNLTRYGVEVGGTDDFENNYTYDDLHRLTQFVQDGQSGGNAVAVKRVDFAYDAASQYDKISRFADAGGTDLVAMTDYLFDLTGRLAGFTHYKGGTTFADYDWTYDAANRITAFTSANHSAESATYSYDDFGQLTGADRSGSSNDESYTYDDNGNRTGGGYSTGDANRLESDGTFDYEYDDEGNRTKRTRISGAAADDYIAEYTWDHRNRLTSVTFKNNSSVVTKVVEYECDVFNRRILKTVDTDGDTDVDFRERYIWSDYENNVVLDIVDDDLDGATEASELARRYLWGAAVDQLFAQENIDSLVSTDPEDVRWALTDNQGTVRDLAIYDDGLDTTTIDVHYALDTFGNILSGDETATRFIYTAQEYDLHTGEWYYNARWYSSYTATFLSADPIQDDFRNTYRAFHNSPTNAVDPTGLDWLWPWDSNASWSPSKTWDLWVGNRPAAAAPAPIAPAPIAPAPAAPAPAAPAPAAPAPGMINTWVPGYVDINVGFWGGGGVMYGDGPPGPWAWCPGAHPYAGGQFPGASVSWGPFQTITPGANGAAGWISPYFVGGQVGNSFGGYYGEVGAGTPGPSVGYWYVW
jgi:RHS repeat-associated protein